MGKIKDTLIRESETQPTCGGCGVKVDKPNSDCGPCQRAESDALEEDADREMGLDRPWKD